MNTDIRLQNRSNERSMHQIMEILYEIITPNNIYVSIYKTLREVEREQPQEEADTVELQIT